VIVLAVVAALATLACALAGRSASSIVSQAFTVQLQAHGVLALASFELCQRWPGERLLLSDGPFHYFDSELLYFLVILMILMLFLLLSESLGLLVSGTSST